MRNPKMYNLKFENLTTATVIWLFDLAKELNVKVKKLCWVSKTNSYITYENIMINNADDNFFGEVHFESDNKKVLKFATYLFKQRIKNIDNLNIYLDDKQNKQKT